MHIFKRIWKDLSKGENIDLYGTVIVAFVVVILSVIGIAPAPLVASITLTVLGLIAISNLNNRHRLEELSNALSHSAETIFLDEFPETLQKDIETATELWLVGITLLRTVKTHYSVLERKLSKGHVVKVLLIHPEGAPLEMAEARTYGRMDIVRTQQDINNVLKDLCQLRLSNPANLHIRTIKSTIGHGTFGMNPNSPSGVLYLENYPYKVEGESRPKFVLRPSDGRWYELYQQELNILWKNASDWECQTENIVEHTGNSSTKHVHTIQFNNILSEWKSPTGWQPKQEDGTLQLVPHDNLSKVLTFDRITGFVNGSIECEVFLEPGALFDIVIRGEIHDSSYLARFDSRPEYWDCLLYKSKETQWTECNSVAALKGHSPHNTWLTMRVVANGQIISLYRDGQEVDRIDNAGVTPGGIAVFAEVANAYVRKLVVSKAI